MDNVSTCQCEVCGAEVKVEESYLNNILCEAHGKCDKCKLYAFDYAYGGFVVFIGEREFVWSYCQAEKIQIDIKAQMKATAAKAKKLLANNGEEKKG